MKQEAKSYTLSIQDVMKQTGKTRPQVYRWVALTGELPAVNPAGSWRISQEDLDAFLKHLDEVDVRLGLADICARLSLSRWRVERLLRSGELHGEKIGRDWRVSEKDFQVFLQANSNVPDTTLRRAS